MSHPKPWHATLVTLFPEAFPGPMGLSLAGKALDKGLWSMECVNIRDFATDRHHTVDDTPAGGGAGMVMKPNVVDAALLNVADKPGPLLFMSPRGRLLDSGMARELAAEPGVRLLCGRYEGIDQRVLDKHQVREISLGDFVLSGGEPAAMAILDSIIRLLPGVLGADASLDEESFERGLLEYPHFTRPADWAGVSVPEVLLSGHHKNINAWRLAEAERVTMERRPDLWNAYTSGKH